VPGEAGRDAHDVRLTGEPHRVLDDRVQGLLEPAQVERDEDVVGRRLDHPAARDGGLPPLPRPRHERGYVDELPVEPAGRVEDLHGQQAACQLAEPLQLMDDLVGVGVDDWIGRGESQQLDVAHGDGDWRADGVGGVPEELALALHSGSLQRGEGLDLALGGDAAQAVPDHEAQDRRHERHLGGLVEADETLEVLAHEDDAGDDRHDGEDDDGG
jgi:hypothetical protein